MMRTCTRCDWLIPAWSVNLCVNCGLIQEEPVFTSFPAKITRGEMDEGLQLFGNRTNPESVQVLKQWMLTHADTLFMIAAMWLEQSYDDIGDGIICNGTLHMTTGGSASLASNDCNCDRESVRKRSVL